MRNTSIILSFFILSFSAFASDKAIHIIDTWSATAPLSIQAPVFTDSAKINTKSLLNSVELDLSKLRPNTEDYPLWFPNQALRWSNKTEDTLKWRTDGTSTCGFAASYVSSSRFQKVSFKVETKAAIAVYIDGKKTEMTAEEDSVSKKHSGSATLHSGKHLFLIQVVADQKLSEVSLTAWFELDSVQLKETLTFSTDAKFAPADFADWGKFHELANTGVSFDGKYVSVIHSSRDEKYKKSSWLEIFDRASGKRVHTIRGDKTPGSPQWFPKSHKIAFTTNTDDGAILWSYDLTTHEQKQLLKAIDNMGKYVISPDEKLVYFAVDEEKKPEHERYDKFEEVYDRVSDWNNNRNLNVASLQSGVKQSLTALGEFAVDNWELSREGNKIIFIKQVPKIGRPYSYSEFWVLDLKSGTADKVLTRQLIEAPESLCWLPGETKVAYSTGGYESFADDSVFHGVNQHNLHILDIPEKTSTNLSAQHLFSLKNIYYNPTDKNLWVNGEAGGKIRFYKTNPNESNNFVPVELSSSLADIPALSKDGSVLVYSGTSPLEPFALYTYDTKNGKEAKILDPNAEIMKELYLTSVEKFEFTNPDGFNIEGWVYKPHDFDFSKKYPLVVYYYAGVTPRDERFTFSYQWLCANGYVVYVLNPVGCIGYGQAFADFHSNDWGTLASRDVILGTQKILAAKPYLNEKKVACYGGSYGGFITLDVLTKTNMFACACDMYGISNITNYFGAGMWGYLYGDLALPGSYPWKNKDIFVDKSPIYSADKIKTPLLIMHGAVDPNVPPAESDQMFVALKLLGREDVVEVKFKDETHNINVKFENLIDHREMMLEWFDKYLKNEPQAWEARWKK